MSNCITERRVGNIVISLDLIDSLPDEELAKIFKHLVLPTHECNLLTGQVRISAFSRAFVPS